MPISWNHIKDKVNYHLILLIAFFLPLNKQVIPPLIILFFISSLWNKKQNVFKPTNNWSYLLILGFYLLGLSSVLYSDHTSNTLFNSEIKLSLLVFPLSFLISDYDFKKSYRSIFKSFIEGCLAAIVLCLLNAIVNYYYDREISVFFYNRLSFFSHVSYFSMYLNFSIALLYYFWFSPSKKDYIKPRVNFSTSIIISIFVLILSSKTGIFSLFLIHFLAGIYWVIKYKRVKQGLILIISMFMILGISLTYSPDIVNRMSLMRDSITNYDGVPNTSTKIRLVVWEESYSIIKVKPIIGYGTGDVSTVLTEMYTKRGFYELAKRQLNSHNQFIQILIGSGVIGLLYFIFILAFPFKKNFSSSQSLIYLIFLILIVINFMTESMLETQSGIVFFSFFITIFYTISNSKENKLTKFN